MASPTTIAVFGGLIAWSIYRRVKRNIGQQKLRPARSIISITIFSAVTIVLCTFAHTPALMLSIGGGWLLGALLGLVGLKLTKFETTDAGHFYTPDTRIVVALSLLFIGRLAYRFWAIRNVADAPHSPQPYQSPLTYFIFGLIAGYYIIYYIGLFVHTHDRKPAV